MTSAEAPLRIATRGSDLALTQTRHIAARIAKEHEFQTPIDEEDAAARCVAPILEGVRDAAEPPFGKFFKDYAESEW